MLAFGNCWHAYNVKAFLDGSEIASTGAEEYKVASFDYNDGSILTVTEFSYGIIKINAFQFGKLVISEFQILPINQFIYHSSH